MDWPKGKLKQGSLGTMVLSCFIDLTKYTVRVSHRFSLKPILGSLGERDIGFLARPRQGCIPESAAWNILLIQWILYSTNCHLAIQSSFWPYPSEAIIHMNNNYSAHILHCMAMCSKSDARSRCPGKVQGTPCWSATLHGPGARSNSAAASSWHAPFRS